jgi:predicted O-methyltransferase YrrM
MIDAKNVLEVGTLGGVSSIYLASSGPDVKVTTIEIDPERKRVAEEAIANAGLGDRIEVLLGAGVDVLPKIKEDVAEGRRPKFDFVFIDADKPNNLNYYNAAVPMCRSRGCVMVDNVVRRGRLADDNAAREDPNVQGARDVIEAAGKDDRLMSTSMIQTVGEKNYDGFLICIVK